MTQTVDRDQPAVRSLGSAQNIGQGRIAEIEGDIGVLALMAGTESAAVAACHWASPHYRQGDDHSGDPDVQTPEFIRRLEG